MREQASTNRSSIEAGRSAAGHPPINSTTSSADRDSARQGGLRPRRGVLTGTLAAILLVAVSVAGLTGLGAFTRDIAATRQAYQMILDGVAYHAEVVDGAIRSLDDDWRAVRRLIDRNARLAAEVEASKAAATVAREKLEELSRDHAEVLETQQKLLQDLAAIEREVKRLTGQAGRDADGLHRIGYEEGTISPGERALLLRIQGIQGRIEAFKNALSQLETSRRDILERMSAHAAQQVVEMERIIASIGLDVEDLLAASTPEEGLGGPFVALSPPHAAAAENRPGVAPDDNLIRWDMLRGVIETLPLAAPLDSYRIGSPFGKRRDPFNRRWAFHQGVDLNAPNRSPVLATAAGEVVFAGWQRNYGRLIEIRHNEMVTTKYAHLARIDVGVGEKVTTGQVIGLLGASGRATGPHLHYEVLVDGEVRDPMKFIGADGRIMQAADAN
ncbi:MAG: hypothetical protein EA406_05035 [Rhodospirillales bacterium]|nr:MAG: hypothetical protein EA406_05035 [Rhodospirillales bacterium]